MATKVKSTSKAPARPAGGKTVAPKKPFWQNDRNIGLLFAAVAFLLYIQSVGFSYALDDRAVMYENAFVKDGFGGFGKLLTTFYWHGHPTFAQSNSGLFRPVSMLLFATEWQLFPDKPGVYHFVSVLLYALSAYLLYRTLRELFRDYSVTLPVLATLLWIVHPTHTEVVANIKSADEILSVIFFCLMMRSLLRWTDTRLLKHALFSAGFFFLSLLSKEGAALFFPVALLALYLFRGQTIRQLVKPSAALLGVALLWFAWHTAVIMNGPERKEYSYLDNSLFATEDKMDRIATATGMQGDYLLKAFTGFPLSWDYSYNQVPLKSFGDAGVLLSLAVCAGLLVLAFLRLKKDPVLSFGILAYFITFALTSNIFMQIGATMADRFLFVPTLGFAIAVAWLVLKLTKGVQERQLHFRAVYVLLPVLLFYSIRSYARSKDWAYESYLYMADVETVPNSSRANANCGVLLVNNAIAMPAEDLRRRPKLDSAYTYFKRAADIDPNNVGALQSLGQIEYHRNNYAASVAWSRRCIEVYKKISVKLVDSVFVDPVVYANLGDAYRREQKHDSAAMAYHEATVMNPKYVDAFIKEGEEYLALHDTARGLVSFRKAAEADPKSWAAWDKLANVLGLHKEYEKSNEASLAMTKLDPANPLPYRIMALNYQAMGDTIQAAQYSDEYYKRGGK